MKKALLIIIAVIAVSIVIAYYGKTRKSAPVEGGVPRVSASFYTLAHFAGKVGGDAISVESITPAGTESHDFEPTAKDISRVYSSGLFIYNGGGFDAWAEKVSEEAQRKGVTVLEMMSALGLSGIASSHQSDAHDHAQSGTNPHFWLDPLLAIKEVELIREQLSKAYPDKAGTFNSNAVTYIKEIQKLHQRFEEGLKDCATKDAVVTHDAFSRLGERYGINLIPVVGLSPEEEPSAKRIRDVSRIVNERSIGYIFFETLVSPKIAETIAKETGAKTLVLDPVEGVITVEGKADDYISLMDKNLSNLRTALSCR